jgi:hypothetical protein
MRYVAFIDTLGFKQQLQGITHEEAKSLIQGFNREIYALWSELGYQKDTSIKGRTFSDSLIVFTDGTSIEHLKKLISFLVRLYRVSLVTCGLPLRGGIAVGEYDDIQATEFSNLQKGIVVGGAFIDAYALESANGIKGSKILFKQEIKLKIEKSLSSYKVKGVKKDATGNEIYELKWGDITYLVDENYSSLSKFVDLACKSKWIDHYFCTLDTFLAGESKEDKRDIYVKIVGILDTKYTYNEFDAFIENFMRSSCSVQLKKSFLGFMREHLSQNAHNKRLQSDAQMCT